MTWSSPDAFVKALRTTNDPELAISAWKSDEVYFPSKAEFLSSWAFNQLLKNKQSLHDLRIWSLLESILLSHQALPPWTSALLFKTPVVPILTSILRSSAEESDEAAFFYSLTTYERVLGATLPLVYPRTRFESILECFWASLECISHKSKANSASGLSRLAIAGFRVAFTKATTKAKVYNAFLDSHFDKWLQSWANMANHLELQELIWAAGRDVLSSSEAIRIMFQSIEGDHTNLFKKLQSLPSTVTSEHAIIPRLFSDQISAVVSQRATLDQLGVTVSTAYIYSRFAAACRVKGMDGIRAQGNLLRTVEDMGKISVDPEWNDTLGRTIEWCLEQLESRGPVASDRTSCLLDAISIVCRIDYALLLPHTKRALRVMALTDSRNRACHQLREIMVAYYSKTRTLDQFYAEILAIIPSLSSSSSADALSCDPRHSKRHIILEGSILSIEAGSQLSSSLARFLTPRQVAQVASSIVSASIHTIEKAQNAVDYMRRQRVEFDDTFVEASYVMRLASFVIPALSPTPSQTSHQIFSTESDRYWDGLITPALGLCFDVRNKEIPGCQMLATSIFRLVSCTAATSTWVQRRNPFDIMKTSGSPEIVLKDLKCNEMELELVRALIRYSPGSKLLDIFTHILHRLSQPGDWDGKLVSINENSMSTAYWFILTRRWLDAFARQAETGDLEQFSAFVLSSYTPLQQEKKNSAITHAHMVENLLRDASFWEYERLHGALLSLIMRRTSKLDSMQINQTNETASLSQDIFKNWEMFGRLFHLLLYFPSEILRGSNGRILAQRAILADMAFSMSGASVEAWVRPVLRIFSSRRLQDDSPSFRKFISQRAVVVFLSTSNLQSTSDLHLQENFNNATKAILDVAFPQFLRCQDVGTLVDDLRLVLSFPAQGDAFLSAMSPWKYMCWSSLLCSIGEWFKTTSLSTSVAAIVDRTILDLSVILQRCISSLMPQNLSELPPLLALLRDCLLAANSRLQAAEQILDDCISSTLSVLRICNQSKSEALGAYVELLSLLAYAIPLASDKATVTSKIISIYYFAACTDSQTYERLDEPLRRAVKQQNVDEYKATFELLHEMVLWKATPDATLIHILTVFLREAPEGTFKIARAAVTRNLGYFKDIGTQWDNEAVSTNHQILSQLLFVCRDKPAYLQVHDVGSIFTLLNRIAEPSTTHQDGTLSDIFHSVIRITSALIRNRRDLVVHLLPHLVTLLSELISHFHTPKPNLGQRQLRDISKKLPAWINLNQPLGGQEAASLARLLVSLTTKTVTRSKSFPSLESGYDTQSLAKPFGKHAYAVLKAYVEVANDPLCLLGREVRSELAPGLYALCGMCGERGRDSLMPMLDGGGKMILKMLWSSYEAQRYTGQG